MDEYPNRRDDERESWFTQVLIDLYCMYSPEDPEKTSPPEYCCWGPKKPGPHCMANGCEWASWACRENELGFADHTGEVRRHVPYPLAHKEFSPELDKLYKDKWREICLLRKDGAYEEFKRWLAERGVECD